MKLTPEERLSSVWKKIEAHYEERLQSLRAQNDNDRDEAKTVKLRGQIFEVKGILKLAEEPERIPHQEFPGA